MSRNHPETRASLILRLQNAADIAAWDEFVELYSPVVERSASRLGLQAADAENVAQEVFLRVARSVTHWLDREDRGSFRAWLLTIAKNETLSLLSRRATRPFVQVGDSSNHLENLADLRLELSAELDGEYQREVFQWAAAQVRESVAEHTWQAFWLTQIEGISVDDAARQLGIHVGNVYIARSRVMSRLKQLVQQFEVPN